MAPLSRIEDPDLGVNVRWCDSVHHINNHYHWQPLVCNMGNLKL